MSEKCTFVIAFSERNQFKSMLYIELLENLNVNNSFKFYIDVKILFYVNMKEI